MAWKSLHEENSKSVQKSLHERIREYQKKSDEKIEIDRFIARTEG
jgi:hypothetical protein